ncbi:MAG: carboxypeptidase regulatory-like domain-containing protein [Acidobacteria bacterium]|nr:MAG: hypothetical protein AUH13_26145 [Acidobacteria bacterium 13_2_20CM_58_27]PYT75727.1 MAG: carboxypeptidase regulatory-like domain-containing protein [Acidobacteriota bacterium]PYT84414.1 MAG: carboxypeptidase regulatory-like domain-containing protein [Acidobacteriota bacterium]
MKFRGFDVCKRSCCLRAFLLLSVGLLPSWECSALAQQSAVAQTPQPSRPKSTETGIAAGEQPPGQELVGTISGTIVDGTEAPISEAHIKLSREGHPDQDVVSDDGGQFSFNNVTSGPFQLTISYAGFTPTTYSGTVSSGGSYIVPPIVLIVATKVTDVWVSMSQEEIAEAEIKDQEKQRIFGALPNFYVTYDPAAPPLTSKQKFKLAWKATTDPINIAVAAGTAGMEQAQNSSPGYGQGAQGYAKRFGAAYADSVTGTFLGAAILPSLFKQDPRYFYKGTGTVRSRMLYALAASVICKSDNGRWQTNYSVIVAGFVSAGISNLYYAPAADRGRPALTVENALIGIGSSAVTNVLQEFLFRKLTPRAPNYASANP